VSWKWLSGAKDDFDTEQAVELLLIGAAFGLMGMVWVSRVRFAGRFKAAIDVYAERQISRESGTGLSRGARKTTINPWFDASDLGRN
jgi:hypothetical protein